MWYHEFSILQTEENTENSYLQITFIISLGYQYDLVPKSW